MSSTPTVASTPPAPGDAAAAGRRTLPALAEAALVLAGALALAVLATWPLARELGSAAPTLGDPLGAIAWLGRLVDGEGFHLTGTTHVTATGAPFGWEQGNGVNIQWLLPFGPAYLAALVVGEVAAYNLVVVLGLALSGAAMYLLVRRLGLGWIAATWAGLVYMVFPWHMARADSHASLAHLEGFPLLILAVVLFRERPDLRRGALVAGATGLLFVTSAYYGAMGLIALAVLLLAAMATYDGPMGAGARVLRTAAAGAASAGVGLVLYGISLLGSADQGFGTGERSVAELFVYGSRAVEWLTPPVDSALLGALTPDDALASQHGSNPSETALFVGYVTLALALVWIGARAPAWGRLANRTRFLLVGLPALTVVGWIFSLPSPFDLGPWRIDTPARLVFEAAPELRVSSRFIVLVMSGLVPLGALGLAMLCRAARRRSGPLSPALAAGLVGVAAIGLSAVELWTDRPPPVPLSDDPPEYAALERVPPGNLIEYPYLPPDDPGGYGILAGQREHGRPLVNGGPEGSTGDALRPGLIDPAAPQTAPALAGLGVTAVIDRRDPAMALELGPGYELVERTPGGVAVWRVTAEPGAAVSLGTGFGPPEYARPGVYFQWLERARGRVYLYAPRAGLYRARFEAGSFRRERRLRVEGAGGAAAIRVGLTAPAQVTLRLPEGLSTLGLRATPGLEPTPDGRRVSVAVSNWTVTPVSEAEAGPGPVVAARGT
jgi:hypothetical protein